jgi:hypothetical protein
MDAPHEIVPAGIPLTSQRPMSAAKPTLKQISWRAVHDPRLASSLREIWGNTSVHRFRGS